MNELITIKEVLNSLTSLGVYIKALEEDVKNSIPISKLEEYRDNHMQYLADCGEDDSDREVAQAIFNFLEKLINEAKQG